MAIKLGPLGIILEQPALSIQSIHLPVSQEALDKLRIIEDWDFSAFKLDAKMLDVIGEVYLDALIIEAKRFLALSIIYKDPDWPITPSKYVDVIWHSFILDTQDYMDFCNKVYGAYLHHSPEKTASATAAKRAGPAIGHTKTLMTATFGGINPNVWGVAAHCNTAACRVIPD